jgi:hypothetical protein
MEGVFIRPYFAALNANAIMHLLRRENYQSVNVSKIK